MTNKQNKLKIKICGMKYRENIEEIAALNPDYFGFIFYDKSPRFINENNEAIQQFNNSTINKVGVFVNATFVEIIDTAHKYQLDLIQLHGNETPEECKALKSIGYIIIKAFQIDSNFDFNQLKNYDKVVDYYLFDTKTKNYGGSGKKFDWEILKQYDNHKPFFLSGGIGPNDASTIAKNKELSKLNIHALDINSNFENAAALKDIKAVEHFMSIIRDEL